MRRFAFCRRSLAALLLATLGCCASLATGAERQRSKVAGIPNFDNVTETVLRGGQPRPEGYESLKQLGVEIVVSFRDERDAIAKERQAATALGMQFVSIPWSGLHSPHPQQVQQFFDLLDANAGRKVFLHCRRGAERTGVMVALYRIARHGWTGEQAYREMEEHGFRGLWFGHLKKYVFDYARQAHALRVDQAVPESQTQR